MENLDAMNGGVVGVFIAPTTKLDRWLGCLFDGAPDSPVHTGQSTTKLDRWLGCLFDGAPDSPVHTGQSGAPCHVITAVGF